MMDATYKALIEGLTSALADDDLDLSGVSDIEFAILQQQRTQLGIAEPVHYTGNKQPANPVQSGPLTGL